MKQILSSLLISLVLIGCSTSPNQSTNSTLYEELNGHTGLEQLVDAFIEQIAYDEQIFPYFAKANVDRFRDNFITHMCDVSGGPCKYQGDSMIDIHTGMNINEADFNRVVELLINAMEEIGIAYPTQNKLLSRLAPLRPEIINK
ncbi:group I truncated hemoglobin [Litoribrevibacter albus]|uniref:group I truncated hemoglobin n=1 Tax=Litoribrevibacter albus TaxID=1473156 RepID=UPI0024E04A06|nr:group 1 truncated hemoglobin [Litoribrevibacter albus]